jgi:hypothetical protein
MVKCFEFDLLFSPPTSGSRNSGSSRGRFEPADIVMIGYGALELTIADDPIAARFWSKAVVVRPRAIPR